MHTDTRPSAGKRAKAKRKRRIDFKKGSANRSSVSNFQQSAENIINGAISKIGLQDR